MDAEIKFTVIITDWVPLHGDEDSRPTLKVEIPDMPEYTWHNGARPDKFGNDIAFSRYARGRGGCFKKWNIDG